MCFTSGPRWFKKTSYFPSDWISYETGGTEGAEGLDRVSPHHVRGRILDLIVAMVSELEYCYWK